MLVLAIIPAKTELGGAFRFCGKKRCLLIVYCNAFVIYSLLDNLFRGIIGNKP